MKLETQVVSLDLAKRLKELGVKQESYANWIEADEVGVFPAVQLFELAAFTKPIRKLASAFTVAELGELLPMGFRSFRRHYKETDGETGIVWRCESPIEHSIDQWPVEADTEANVRAKYLAKLIESGKYMRKDESLTQ